MTLATYCPRCGAQRSDLGPHCPSCGQDLRVGVPAPPPPPFVPTSALSTPLVATAPSKRPGAAVDCPDGPHPDFVRKVSAVYTEGVGRTSMAGGTYSVGFNGSGDSIGAVSMSGVSQTALSARLAPPPEPVYESPWTGGWLLLMVLCLVFLVVGLIIIGVIIIYRWLVGQNRRAAVARRHPLWEPAMARWQQAYYCAKCDAVFIPGLVGLVPARDAQGSLFSYNSAA
jgi:hypothetical protein